MRTVADLLYRLTLLACVAFLGVILAGQVAIVLMRYVMGIGFLQLQDLVNYAFACLVVLSVALAMRAGRHVRVDVLRERQSGSMRRLTDRLGHLAFTLPVFGLIAYDGWPLISASWRIGEGAVETGGLPGLYLVKSTVLVMCALIIVFAIADLFSAGEGGESER